MLDECLNCASSGDGCGQQDWSAAVAELRAVAASMENQHVPIESVLNTLAACILTSAGCRRSLALALFPIVCTCTGLSEYFRYAVGQVQLDAEIEEILRNAHFTTRYSPGPG